MPFDPPELLRLRARGVSLPRPIFLDGTILTDLLERSGLFESDLATQAGKLSGQFPAAVERNIFLEFELREDPVPAGFGLGFPAGILDHYAATNHWFLQSPTGRAIEDAMSEDPFAADHLVHLNLFNDPDPDWIEYDVIGDRLEPSPFVFFRLPSRFRTISTSQQARALGELLPSNPPSSEFIGLLDALLANGPVVIYRVGVSRRRGPAWWRAIVTNLSKDQVAAVLSARGGCDFGEPLAIARGLYAGRIDTPGACFALSIDVHEGRISALDVECPYLFRISDRLVRSTAARDLLHNLARIGILSAKARDWLSDRCCMEVGTESLARSLRISLHHLKYRFFGSPSLRTKAYFHLEMIEPAELEVACPAPS